MLERRDIHQPPSGRHLRVLELVEANVGGVRRVLEELVRALVDAGHHVTVAYSPQRGPESEEAAEAYARAGAVPIVVPMRRSPSPWHDLRAVLALVRLLRRGDFALVHCHSSKAGVLGRIAARIAGVPKCFYSPHAFAFDGARWPLIKWCTVQIERSLVPWTDLLIAVSQYEAIQARDLGTPLPGVQCIPNGTRLVPPAEVRPPGSFRVGAAGRLVRQKGFDILIGALSEVRRDYPDSHLVIAGEGPERPRLAQMARRLRVPVEFTGRLPLLDDWFKTIDLFAHAARWESMPLVILEAMSHGVPVVATAVGGVPELVHGGTGSLARAEDPHELAARIMEVFADPQAARDRARQARRTIEAEYNIERAMASYLALYERVLGERDRQGSMPDSNRQRAASDAGS